MEETSWTTEELAWTEIGCAFCETAREKGQAFCWCYVGRLVEKLAEIERKAISAENISTNMAKQIEDLIRDNTHLKEEIGRLKNKTRPTLGPHMP